MLHEPFALFLMGLLGLAVGSFLNVLIHRLPIMIEQADALVEAAPHHSTGPSLNLARPASHCPTCQHPIAWYDNIPVLSFVCLRGRCRHCQTRISWQYPVVELVCASLFVWAGWQYPSLPTALAWSIFASSLLALAVIDARTFWLPDALTQPLLWAGLVASALGWIAVDLHTSLAGAVVGYLSLWAVYWGFLLVTGKHGMGYGDFKLNAALGAWLGWHALLPVLLIASLSSLAFAGWQMLRGRMRLQQEMPFGPFLALAGVLVLCLDTAHWVPRALWMPHGLG